MKKIISLCLVLIFVFCIFLQNIPAFASDPLSIGMAAATSYMLGSSWGISFLPTNASGIGMQNYMETQIERYINHSGGTLESLFGSDALRVAAGKILIGQNLYNGVKNFISWMADEFGIDGVFSISDGTWMGDPLPYEGDPQQQISPTGLSIVMSEPVGIRNYKTIDAYVNGSRVYHRTAINWSYGMLPRYGLDLINGEIWLTTWHGPDGDGVITTERAKIYSNPVLDNALSWDGSNYIEPTVLNPGQEWQGKYNDTVPDTNIDQLLEDIFKSVSDITLDAEGEIVDPIVPPTPTPAPIDPDTPLQDVPWEGLNDLIDITGKDIVDSLDDLKDLTDEGAKDIVESLEGLKDLTEEGVQDIVQSMEGVGDDVKDLTDTLEDALTAPEIDEKTFDLRELFPFCIPFDIYHLLQQFDATPAAPHVQLPIVIPSIGFSYTLDLDFSAWNPVAAAMRTAELIVYALGLAWATSKVIKW